MAKQSFKPEKTPFLWHLCHFWWIAEMFCQLLNLHSIFLFPSFWKCDQHRNSRVLYSFPAMIKQHMCAHRSHHTQRCILLKWESFPPNSCRSKCPTRWPLLRKRAHLFSLPSCEILWNWINTALYYCLWVPVFEVIWQKDCYLPSCICLLLPGLLCSWCQADKVALRSLLPGPWCLSCRGGAVAIWALVTLWCSCGTPSYQQFAAPWWICRVHVGLLHSSRTMCP